MPNRFSVTWSGYLTVPSPGTFQLATTSDDGSQVYVDDQLVVENGGTHAVETRTGQIRLTSGAHRVVIVFTQSGGGFAFDWSWGRIGEARVPVPPWLLSRRASRYEGALLARALDIAIPPVLLGAAAVLLWTLLTWLRDSRLLEGLADSLAAVRLPGPPRFVSPRTLRIAERVLVVVAAVLPLFFIAHALAFWGHGVIDEEATTFVINYLADRPFLQAIFDPRLNDWGSFQARELAYVFDRMDARVFARLLVDWHVLLFVPLSSVLSLVVITWIYLFGARRVLKLDRTTSLLLLSLFLSCIVTQASTPILYRSSKMLLCVMLLAFMFRLASLLEPGRAAVTVRNGIGLFVLGVLATWCDRQGYAFMLATTTVMVVLWVKQRWLPQPPGAVKRAYGAVSGATAAATGWAILYNNVLAPRTIVWANGYWPDLSYEDIPLERFNATLALNALAMFRDQVSYFFGNAPFLVVCLLGLVVWIAVRVHQPRRGPIAWRQRLTGTGVILTSAFAGTLLVLIAVMGMRHPPVFRIPDHAFWYYTLSMQAVLLFGASLVAAQLHGTDDGRRRRYGWLLLIVMIVGNVAHYPGQRRLMEASGIWFGKQYAFAQLYAQAFAADEANAPESARVLPSWMRIKADRAEVHLPLPGYGLLDAIRAGYTTLKKRPPLVDAGGPYWRELRDFLDGTASPFIEPGQTADALDALQSVGIRRFVVHRDQFDPRSGADAVVDGARSMGERVRSMSERDGVVSIELPDTRREPVSRAGWQAVPASAFRLSASQNANLLPLALDGDADTAWDSVTRQSGNEWIRVDFDAPRHIAALRLVVTDQGLDRYPRRLRIESIGADDVRTLFDGSTLRALTYGLLTQPVDAPIELVFPANQSQALMIRQTGASPSWSWAVRELTLFETAAP